MKYIHRTLLASASNCLALASGEYWLEIGGSGDREGKMFITLTHSFLGYLELVGSHYLRSQLL